MRKRQDQTQTRTDPGPDPDRPRPRQQERPKPGSKTMKNYEMGRKEENNVKQSYTEQYAHSTHKTQDARQK
jgi:hypothetical protein